MLSKGYDSISLSEICKKSEVSVGCFYHHFGAKEEIIFEVYRQADQKFAMIIENDPITGDTVSKILQLFTLQMQGAIEIGVTLLTQLYKSQITYPNNFLFSKNRIMPKVLTTIITEGQKDGSIRKDYTPEYMVRELLRFSRGVMYDWCAHGGEYDIIQDLNQSMSLYLQSFTPQKD